MVQTLDVFESDAVILDLEDSVDVRDKDAALELIHQFLRRLRPHNIEIYVRLNDLETTLKEEVKRLNNTDINGYVIPKATHHLINEVEALTDKPLIALIESPRSVLNALEIADCKSVIGIILGGEDLSTSLGANRTKEGLELFTARQLVVLAARASNIEAIDTPFTDPIDELGLMQDCQTAKGFGFTGKTAIHPNQIEAINQTFVPSKEAINDALRIVIKAKTATKGAFSLDGKMIDKPIIERAKSLLKLAQNYGLYGGDDLE